ncbi:intracellular septation protein [Monaibacterium marinum]|uniref:Inner membrane-spanning protein YciB n=1 Tax=Pontivivens marinum TaxID=1690039 RepID=A0A2C9CSC6_9RHOB|nr:inner membrane-spanning protein YciB [Monaibacterium marinum]SOH94157.1 intracellular septation protein [Monaibacterium marinum]
MAEAKKLNPILKLVLEVGPVGAYFFAYQRFSDQGVTYGGVEYSGVVAATAIFVPLILISLVISWALTRTLPRMAVFTAIIVVVFGGLTIWLNDDVFTKMRPTVVYSLFAFILGFGVWVQGRSYLRYLMGEVMPLSDEGWMIFTRNWAIFFAAMALFNEFTWRVLGEEAWIWLDTFGQMILTFIFIATQFPLLQRHSTEDDE